MISAEVVRGFEEKLLLKSFDNACDIPPCHSEWWEACCSPSRFVAIAAPRGFAKSTAITHTYALAKVCFRESSFVVIVSDSESQATLFLNDIKKEIETNEDLRILFDIDGITKSAETDIIVRFKDGNEFRIMAKGSEQKLRGLKWNKKRPDLIICDDMENDELVMNKERRYKFQKWFASALMPVLSDKGMIRIVGTILHHDSLLNSFMPNPSSKHTVNEDLKMYSTIQSGWHSLLYRAHNKDFSKLLWPDKMPEEKLKKLRKVYEDQGLLDVYSQEYLNNPIDESNTHFRRSDFLPLTDEDRKKPLTYYVTLDGAWSLGQQADYTVFLVAGMDSDGYIQVRQVIKDRIDSQEVAETLFHLVRLYDPAAFITEKGAFANSILPAVYRKMDEEELFFNIELITPSQDKVHRSQAIRLRARAGRVKVDKTAEWYQDFEDELMAFPRQGHDDQVDAFSLVGIALNKLYEGPTIKDLHDEAFEEEKRHSGMYEVGRSEFTGY